MKKLSAVWLASALLAALPLTSSAAGPKMELSLDVWDMGEIYQWTNPSVNIDMRNTGAEDLKVLDVKASCGCTAVVVSDKVIKPGGKGLMRISFNPNSGPGRVRKIVKLFTNDPAFPEKTINIQGVIKADKAAVGYLRPDYLDLGVVAPYETRYFEVTIVNKGNIDLQVKGVDLPQGFFLDSSYPGSIGPAGVGAFRVGYRPGKSKGPISEEIKVLSNSLDQQELKLRLAGYVSEMVRSIDAFIITPTGFSVKPGALNPVLEVAVKNEGTRPIIIDGAETSLESLEPKLSRSELEPGGSGTVSIPLKPESLKPDTKGYIYLRLAVPVVVEGAGNK